MNDFSYIIKEDLYLPLEDIKITTDVLSIECEFTFNNYKSGMPDWISKKIDKLYIVSNLYDNIVVYEAFGFLVKSYSYSDNGRVSVTSLLDYYNLSIDNNLPPLVLQILRDEKLKILGI